MVCLVCVIFRVLLFAALYEPFDTEFNCKYRISSVRAAPVVSPIGLKNDRCNSSGRCSPRINLQWLTKSAALAKPFGISRASSCESILFIFGAELNEPILCATVQEKQKKSGCIKPISKTAGHVSVEKCGNQARQFDKYRSSANLGVDCLNRIQCTVPHQCLSLQHCFAIHFARFFRLIGRNRHLVEYLLHFGRRVFLFSFFVALKNTTQIPNKSIKACNFFCRSNHNIMFFWERKHHTNKQTEVITQKNGQ